MWVAGNQLHKNSKHTKINEYTAGYSNVRFFIKNALHLHKPVVTIVESVADSNFANKVPIASCSTNAFSEDFFNNA
jgi:hypothetical protein